LVEAPFLCERLAHLVGGAVQMLSDAALRPAKATETIDALLA
jgi:hypothetical protein